jgi:hypothetical protein
MSRTDPSWRRIGAATLAGALAGCTLPSLPEEEQCGPARRQVDGSCCTRGSTASDSGCSPRQWRELEPLGEGSPAALSLAVDGRGRGLVAWTEGTRVFAATESSSGTWDARSDFADVDGGTALQIDSAAGPDGEALVAWRTNGVPAPDGSHVYYAAKRPNEDWVATKTPVSFGDRAYEPRVAIGPHGDAILLWNQWYDDAHFGVAFATAPSVSEPFAFPASAGDVLSPPVFYSNGPRVAVGSEGQVVVTWYQAQQELMTYVSERDSREDTMSRPAIGDYLSAPGAPVDSHPVSNPKPALGPHGQAAIAWTQEDGRNNVRVFLATRDGAGTWYRPRDLDDAISGSGYSQCAELAFGSHGDLFVVFQEDNHAMLSVRGADGTWLTPRGSPILLSKDDTLGLDPHIATGTDGSVVIVFHELDGETSRLRVLTLESGAPDLAKEPLVTLTGAGFGVPLVAVGGVDARILIGVVEHAGGSSRVRLLSQ